MKEFRPQKTLIGHRKNYDYFLVRALLVIVVTPTCIKIDMCELF